MKKLIFSSILFLSLMSCDNKDVQISDTFYDRNGNPVRIEMGLSNEISDLDKHILKMEVNNILIRSDIKYDTILINNKLVEKYPNVKSIKFSLK
jgi:hypothetical protein